MNIFQTLTHKNDNAALVIFRSLFGLLMVLESFGAIATGWVRKTLVEPKFTFNFIGFDFLQILQGQLMYSYFVIMGIVSIFFMLGYKYKWSSIGLALLWTGCYLMQKASYNNHYYLIMLVSWSFVFLPAAKDFSLDSILTKSRNSFCEHWQILLFKIQLGIVFIFGSIAKLYPGWLEATFIKNAFNAKKNYWLIGDLLGSEPFQYLISYGGIIFDALIVPLLWYKPTRKIAFIGLLIFNLFNSVVFQIGIFPYMVIAMAVFFYDGEWLRNTFLKKYPVVTASSVEPSKPYLLYGFSVFILIQVFLPLRHHFFEGDVNWNEAGHRCSWRMMLRSKHGKIKFEVHNHSNNKTDKIVLSEYLTTKQINDLATKPDFMWQFAQYLKKEYDKEGKSNISIHVTENKVWLNRKGGRSLISPKTDLAKEKWNYFGNNNWILNKS